MRVLLACTTILKGKYTLVTFITRNGYTLNKVNCLKSYIDLTYAEMWRTSPHRKGLDPHPGDQTEVLFAVM